MTVRLTRRPGNGYSYRGGYSIVSAWPTGWRVYRNGRSVLWDPTLDGVRRWLDDK